MDKTIKKNSDIIFIVLGIFLILLAFSPWLLIGIGIILMILGMVLAAKRWR